MRKIDKDFNNAPEELKKCAKQNEYELLETKKEKDYCYKKSKTQLEKQFYKKCAYCETKFTEYTQIEHYRPKSKYYWLAYEWSNLLPSCEKCNNAKSNKFPLINKKKTVKKPNLINKKIDLSKCKADVFPLINEKPFILHPKIDNTQEYLDFKIDENYTGIEIIGTDKIEDLEFTGRGEATINICKLNRPELKIDRYNKVIKDVVDEFYKTFQILQISKHSELDYEKAFNFDFDKINKNSNQIDSELLTFRKLNCSKNIDYRNEYRILNTEYRISNVLCRNNISIML